MSQTNRQRRAQHEEEEERENHERWLISYADMVTLLLCLFIVLFAISQVDVAKFGALSQGLAEGFGAPMAILDDGVASQSPAEDPLKPVELQAEAAIDGKQPTDAAQAAQAEAAGAEQEAIAAEAQVAYDNLAAVRDRIEARLTGAGYPGAARYEIDERGLVVHIIADEVLFEAAEADLRPQGAQILNAVAPELALLPNLLRVEGHANHIPVERGGPWPSNWELSAYRATTVLRYLNSPGGVPETQMSATGYSSTQPLVDIADPTAITVNRRVDIVVLSTASAEANLLLPVIDATRNGPS